MNQSEINEAGRKNSANWTGGSKWLCVHFSQKDSRTWVLKRIPWMGVTLNVGKPSGVAWLIGSMLGIPLIIVVVSLVIMEVTK